MRITGGTHKGRQVKPPMDKWPTRPTTDYAREALFNILANRIDFSEVNWLDLFSGTGIVSLEAISRGCPRAVCVDKYRLASRWLTSLARDWHIEHTLTIRTSDVRKYLSNDHNQPFDIVFADPPYDLPWITEIPDLVIASSVMKNGGVFILEHRSSQSFEHLPFFSELRKYGEAAFTFFKRT